MSPRATRPPKEAAAQPSTRRRPALPTRGRKAAAANGASAEAAGAANAQATREPISWIEMTQPAASVPHVAMPKLMGQPAYARPPRPLAVESPRPLDPDDLPIEAFRSEEDQRLAAQLARHGPVHDNGQGATLRPSSTGGLRGIAGRLLGRS
ncbi:MAG TPA: hypothetical protein VN771_03840 [Candidatus Baltobacteraceae bacterium]|nr:hypothetical protein [Candidatus Baltobacteraceae bacterium]